MPGQVDALTVEEAAQMALVRSSAWASSSAEATDVYWVYAQQVSKQAETGEYLSLGGFMIRGIKNFVGIHSLEIGLGILFRALPSSDSRPSVCNDAEEAKEGERRTHCEGDDAAAPAKGAAALNRRAAGAA